MYLYSDTIDFHGLKIPVETLMASMMITGTTGAGKTRAVLRPLIKSLTSLRADEPEAKCGALVIDPKGFDLLPIVQAALRACGRENDLVLIGPGSGDQIFNPLDDRLSPGQIAAMILAAASTLGQDASSRVKMGERFWETQDRAVLTAVVALSRHALAVSSPGEKLTFGHLQRFRALLSQPEKELRKWASELVRDVGQSEAMPLAEWAALPETTRSCVAASIGTLLHPFGSPPLRSVVQPESGRRTFDLREIFELGKVVVVNTAFAESALELLPAQCMIKAAFTRLALSRYRWADNRSRPCWLIIDEGARVYTAHADAECNETNLMDMSRSSRVGMIWACQNLSALLSFGNEHLVAKFAGLCANHVFLSNTCPACAALAARSLGTKLKYHVHRSREKDLPPPMLFPHRRMRHAESRSGILVPSEAPRVSPAQLARLRTGEMWLRLAHTGEVHHIQADVSAA
jgi:type IV secretory pathway TraG/TraD family ATPase VirD4